MRIALLAAANSIHIAKLANGLVDAGHDVHIVTVHGTHEDLDSRIRIHYLPFSGVRGYLLGPFWCWRKIRKIKPDLTNVHYATGYGFLGRAVSGLKILTTFGSDVLVFPRKSFLHRWFLTGNMRSYDLVVTPSAMMTKACREIHPGGNFVQIPVGVDAVRFSGPAAAREPKKFIIGACRALTPVYGVDLLISAFAQFVKRWNPEGAELHIIGVGYQREQLEEQARQLGLADKVTFHGLVSQQAVIENLRKWHLAVMPSRSEALGVSAIEASACGVPVLATNVGGLPEVVLNGETGLLSEPKAETLAEKIGLLFRDENLRSRLGANGRAFASTKYSLARMIESYEDLYSAVRESRGEYSGVRTQNRNAADDRVGYAAVGGKKPIRESNEASVLPGVGK